MIFTMELDNMRAFQLEITYSHRSWERKLVEMSGVTTLFLHIICDTNVAEISQYTLNKTNFL